MIALLFVTLAHAERPCVAYSTPLDVVEAALRVDGARRAGTDTSAEKRRLLTRLACVGDPLDSADAAAIHRALAGEPPPSRPAPTPDDASDGPPHPKDGVALVDGRAYAALRPGGPALVQAFDGEGQVVYTRWLAAAEVDAVRLGARMPTEPTLPRLPPVPLTKNEVARLTVSSALVAASGALFWVAAEARADWYAFDPSPVQTVEELERLRVRTNVAQGAGIACAGLGAAGLLSVAVRVPF